MTTVCGQDDDILCIQLSQSLSGGDRRLGNTQVSSQRSHGTPGPKSPARQPTHRSTPTRSQVGDLVSKYGVQASASDLEALPLGKNPPPGDSALGSAVPYSPPRSESKRPVERPSSSNTGHSARLATKGSVQQSPVDRPVQSEHVPVTPRLGKPGTGQMTGTRNRYPVPVPTHHTGYTGYTDHTGFTGCTSHTGFTGHTGCIGRYSQHRSESSKGKG